MVPNALIHRYGHMPPDFNKKEIEYFVKQYSKGYEKYMLEEFREFVRQ